MVNNCEMSYFIAQEKTDACNSFFISFLGPEIKGISTKSGNYCNLSILLQNIKILFICGNGFL